MSNQNEMKKAYEPQEVEDQIYANWEASGYFNPDNLEGEPYSIMMPPPNVTGVLHLGHALENSLMDTMARFERLRGKKVLLLPGTDHAAVATQAKVEKNLIAEGIENPREHFGREGLLEKIRDYAEGSKSTILRQIKKMGTSCDWSRLAYTFDDERSQAVNEVFIKMYQDGLIYRGYRVVNWSVKGQSTCSDDELIHVDRQAKIYTFRYSADFPFTIASTRPETKLGDTAVAVHPDDERYQEYIGKEFTVNFCGVDLKLKVIADEHVDPEFGTGALGVTPAHSPIDFEMYERQKAAGEPIGLIPVIDRFGKMTEQAGADFAGLDVEAARVKVLKCLRQNDLLVGEEEIEQSVGTSDRFGDVIEAIPMEQWWLDVQKEIPGKGKSLRDLMKEALTTGLDGDKQKKVMITPERFTKLYLDRTDNLRDWCLSRQIWWGHRIPVWYRGDEIKAQAEKPEGDGWMQDEDTLDTWFSSGLWTFSTLGWPDQTQDLDTFHPTSWMQMGYEILFLWLMRMVLFSAYCLDDIPFDNAYVHGMLRDKHGQKFSKSAGNGIDPIDVVAEYGTDALRWSLLSGTTSGNDSRFYLEKVEDAKHLVNKLWNISRFIISNVENVKSVENVNAETLADRWILGKLSEVSQKVTEHMERYEFSLAGEMLRDFTWNEFADWYLEISKVQRAEVVEDVENVEVHESTILLYILERLLILWHPFMPFVTEEIYKRFDAGMLMIAKWPEIDFELSDEDQKIFADMQEVIAAIRNIRARYNISYSKELTSIIASGKHLESQTEVIAHISKAKITFDDQAQKPEGSASAVVGKMQLYVPLAGIVDLEAERQKFTSELAEAERFEAFLKKKLSDKSFTEKAPAEVVEKEQQRLEEIQGKIASLQREIDS